MAMNINTNVNAAFAQGALSVNARAQTSAMQQLSTGKQINSAKDNSAGLAMSETMTSQIRGLNMAVRNANDGISFLQTAEGAMIEQTNMLQRMRELAVQASSDTVDTNSKSYLNDEFTALRGEIDRIGANTQWNGKSILKGIDATDSSSVTAGSFQFQVGANSTDAKVSITILRMTTDGTTPSLVSAAGLSITSASNASSAITGITTALGVIAQQRAKIGATMNQLTYAADNLTNVAQNATDSRSRILDTDYATATTQLSKTQIISQAATAMLAQANQQQQSVLALLK